MTKHNETRVKNKLFPLLYSCFFSGEVEITDSDTEIDRNLHLKDVFITDQKFETLRRKLIKDIELTYCGLPALAAFKSFNPSEVLTGFAEFCQQYQCVQITSD
jgi:hypothetical protein